MFANPESVRYRAKEDGRHVTCDITATSTPSPFPTTGEGIQNLAPDDILDAGSTLFVTSTATVYIMDENGEFQSVG